MAEHDDYESLTESLHQHLQRMMTNRDSRIQLIAACRKSYA